MKKLFNIFCCLILALLAAFSDASAASAPAESEVMTLMVRKTDGTNHYYSLSSRPVITFDGGLCKIESADVSASYPMSEVEYATFVNMPAGVAEVESSLVIDLSDPDNARIYPLQPDSPVSLYNLSGVMLRHTVADGSGNACVSLATLPAGVYVIYTNETTFKIYRK